MLLRLLKDSLGPLTPCSLPLHLSGCLVGLRCTLTLSVALCLLLRRLLSPQFSSASSSNGIADEAGHHHEERTGTGGKQRADRLDREQVQQILHPRTVAALAAAHETREVVA